MLDTLLDWDNLTLLFYIGMRMTGFVAFSPFFARSGVPMPFRTGLIVMFTLVVWSAYDGPVPAPGSILELAVRLLLELLVGLALNLVIRFFFYIPDQAGELVDTQMGLSMARSYDPGSQASSTVTANLLSQMMLVLFFVCSGHVTLIRLVLDSGDLMPFGTAALGGRLADRCLTLFTECVLLAVKMGFPILGAELMGQVGMGVLMKVIPQINVFAINIELKVVIGLAMLSMMMGPISSYLLEAESYLLTQIKDLLWLMSQGG